MNKTKRVIIQAFNWLRFAVSSMNVFRGNSPELILKIITAFVTLEAPLYKDTLYLGRSTTKSAELLQSLVESYLETKSGVTLNQIMTVLKEEIIEREQRDGRKQLSGRPIRRDNS